MARRLLKELAKRAWCDVVGNESGREFSRAERDDEGVVYCLPLATTGGGVVGHDAGAGVSGDPRWQHGPSDTSGHSCR